MSVAGHLEAAVSYIAIAEAADSSSVAYRKAAEEIRAAMDEDPALTQREVADRISRGTSYVSALLKALSRARDGEAFAIDWQSGSNRRADMAPRIPDQHEARVEMATKLLADPKVAKAAAKTVLDPSTQAGRLLSAEVYERDSEQKRKYADAARQSREDKALPLPAYMATMVTKMNEWALGLAALVDDLDELPEGRGRELVTEAARGLNEQTQRWLDKLEPKPELRVIEGSKRAAS